ncbi:MAG: hypothetical protein IT381_20100 [Deltaproteobacteria bacterium]|nr:hypothetical protein [Deltaproteobacteria bacterium]
MPVVLLLSFVVTQDYMKYMKPYEESPEDLAVAKQMLAIEKAGLEQNEALFGQEVQKLIAMKPKKQLVNLMRSKDPVRRAHCVLGHRLLPIKRAWEDLRFLLMDASPDVRRQVMLYAQEQPAGIDVGGVQMTLSDVDANVRVAAVGAVVKTARKKEVAIDLLRTRLKEEKDPAVIKQLKTGLIVLGAGP